MLRTTRILMASFALAALAGLAACGDDADDADGAAPATTEAASGGSDTGGGMAADCSTPGATVTVDIPDFEFAPDPVEVSACDEIVWSNSHTQAHTSTGSGEQAWSTGNIQPDGSADPVVFDTPGSYPYTCALHPFMKGTVEVS